MKNEIEITDELIAKYLSGEASPDEALALDEWLQVPANRTHFRSLQKMWESSFPSKASRTIDVKSAWTKVQSRRPVRIEPTMEKHVRWNTLYRVAASVLLVLSFAALFYFYQSGKVQQISMSTEDSLKTIRFEDNSTAILNRHSNLTYPQRFADERREVEFTKGEAFFNVAPNAAKPFIIRTGIATIRVLGTAFNVLVTSDTLHVSVDHGKVLVYTTRDSVYLEKGESALLGARDLSFKSHDFDANALAYATHKFVFNNAPVSKVFQYVEKAQNCTIRMANADIGNCKLTATFESVSTDYMLNLITEALNLSVTKNDDRTFTVEGKGCH